MLAKLTAASGSVHSELERGAALLKDAGCETPRLDAELLLGASLRVDRAALVTGAREQVGPGPAARYAELLQRRARREPVAYVLGEKPFRRIVLSVDRRVLIPRPETELLVEVGLELATGARVADVGTGSGAIALALASERPDLRLTGADVSEDALELARANALALGLEVRWLHCDLLAGVADEFDAILANLPYVSVRESDNLAPEIVRHEPPLALFAGPDGLSLIRALLSQLAGRARVRFLALEVGAGQAREVAALMRAAGFRSVRAELDLAGIERVLVAEGRAA